MVTKNATLSNENLELKNQMLSSNNDVSSHAKRNAKHVLTSILEKYKDEGKLKYYDIITTSNLAKTSFLNTLEHSITLSFQMLA